MKVAGQSTPVKSASMRVASAVPKLPKVPRILLAHLGSDARVGIDPTPGLRVCDDLDFVEL